jgi:hypothetical protein
MTRCCRRAMRAFPTKNLMTRDIPTKNLMTLKIYRPYVIPDLKLKRAKKRAAAMATLSG